MPRWGSWVAAVMAGVLMPLAFQPFDWWWIVLPAVALAIVAVRGRRPGEAVLLGLATGALFFGVHISWITVYLGPIPLVALTLWMGMWWGLGGMALAIAWRTLEARWHGPMGAFVGIPAVLGGIWLARESLSSTVPWGGFAWGRLAHSQASSPLADTTSWVGFAGLSFLIAGVAALGVQLVLRHRTMLRRRLTIGAAVLIALVAVPQFPIATTGTVRVGAVQGASEAGLLAPYVPGERIRQHVEATRLLDDEDVDLLVWPENAAEFRADESPSTIATLDSIARRHNAPIVVGTSTVEGDDAYNALLLLEPGDGVTGEYRKRHPVPFAEYLPERWLFLPILESLGFAHLIPRDYAIDPTSANAFDIPLADGRELAAGVAICFDIIDDSLAREMVLDRGAEIILAPTNNADFGRGSAENVQQLAIARLRAVEAGRAVVNISTVGTSAMVAPDGRILDRLPQYEPGAMAEALPLSSTVTPGIAAGAWIEWGLVLASILGVALAALAGRKERRSERA